MDTKDLKDFSNEVRYDILRMVYEAKSGHIGGSLSCADILTVLYNKILNIPKAWKCDPNFKKRDRFILSKGHASPALYSTLANIGLFDREELYTFRKLGTKFQGHPCIHTQLEGIEASTGSLGQGLSIGVGMALAMRLDDINSKVYVLLGDGEIQEGSVWEALMNASHKKLTNIVTIIDKNNLQIDGNTDSVKSIDPLDKKLEAFGWKTETIDGHNFDEIEKALINAKLANCPYAVIANTIKGKGVSFMENNPSWHGKAPKEEEYNLAIKEVLNAK